MDEYELESQREEEEQENQQCVLMDADIERDWVKEAESTLVIDEGDVIHQESQVPEFGTLGDGTGITVCLQ